MIGYEPPRVSSVYPVQFEPGVSATVTIYGENFGTNTSDVKVSLLLTSGGEAPCRIEDEVSNMLLVCTVAAKPGRKIEGFLVVSVGSDWSGGTQNSTKGFYSKIKQLDDPAPVTVTIAKDISEIPSGSAEEKQFVESFVSDVSTAIGLPQDRINVTSITAGSVIVEFFLLPDRYSILTLSPARAAANLVKQAANASVRSSLKVSSMSSF
jgi:hypothetical protein